MDNNENLIEEFTFLDIEGVKFVANEILNTLNSLNDLRNLVNNIHVDIPDTGIVYNSNMDSIAEGIQGNYELNSAEGQRSHAEGIATYARSEASHTEGYHTETYNAYEHALGSYNISHSGSEETNTIHSIGIGVDNDNRKNAMELTQNGDLYIYGVGGHNGVDLVKSFQQYILELEQRINVLEGVIASDATNPELMNILRNSGLIGSDKTKIKVEDVENITDIGTIFLGSDIKTFDEFLYFTSVTSISEGAFLSCSSLTSITIPDSVTSIGNYAFLSCSGLTSIIIPDSVTSINSDVFSYCFSLTEITVDSNNQVYDSRNNCNAIIETSSNKLIVGCQTTIIPDSVTSIGSSAFGGCSNLTSINIPDSVTTIGNDAFSGCSSLTSINIPDSVTSIGTNAFAYCSNLASITSRNTTPPTIYSDTFNNVDRSIPVYVPASAVNNYISANYWNEFTNILAIPTVFYYSDGTSSTTYDTTISQSSRDTSKILVRAELNDSVTSIGDGAFDSCSSLSSINIPNLVTSIGEGVFYYCSSLTSIIIPESVTHIGSEAFFSCSSLTLITIPDSVTSIGDEAFMNCSSLTSITSRNTTPPAIYADTFNNVDEFIPVYVPASAVSTYQSANYWNQFTNILAISE